MSSQLAACCQPQASSRQPTPQDFFGDGELVVGSAQTGRCAFEAANPGRYGLVVECRSEQAVPNPRRAFVAFHRLEVNRMLMGVSDQEAYYAFDPIFGALAAGQRVLINCKAGKHRSRRRMFTSVSHRSGELGAFVAAASRVGAKGVALWWRAFAAKAMDIIDFMDLKDLVRISCISWISSWQARTSRGSWIAWISWISRISWSSWISWIAQISWNSS